MSWITQSDQVRRVLQGPLIRQDSIVGLEQPTIRRVAIPLNHVTRIEIREPDAAKTAGVFAGFVAGVGVALYILIVVGTSGPGS